ncbi:MAG: low molecular weight phosphatase family protein, partial [Candidatus Brocadia sp. WS118]
KRREDWSLDDPTGTPDDEFIAVINIIESKIRLLKAELVDL